MTSNELLVRGDGDALAVPAPEPSAPPPRRSVLHGVAWAGASKWAVQGVTWASTLLVARLLQPGDYGLIAMAAVYLGLAGLVSEFGVGAAIVALRDLTARQIAQLDGLAILFGLAAMLVSWALAIPIGRFYGAPRLPLVIGVASSVFLISSLRVAPLGLLQKELDFRTIGIIDAVQAVVTALATLAFAVAGFGYWTLVLNSVVGASVSAVALRGVRAQLPRWPRRATLREAMDFSAHVLGSRIAWFGYSNSDFLIAGKMLGAQALGMYSFAWTLASAPLEKVTSVVIGVAPPYFARASEDPARLRDAFIGFTRLVSLLSVPVCVGFALVADDFVLGVLGSKWEGAILPLRVLTAYGVVRSVTPLVHPVLQVVGDARFVMWNNIAEALLIPVGFWFASRWGTLGIAATWVVLDPLLLSPSYVRLATRIRLSLGAYLGALWPAFSASGLMALAVLLAKRWAASAAPLLQLSAEVTTGAVVYAAVFLLFHRSSLRRARAFLASAS